MKRTLTTLALFVPLAVAAVQGTAQQADETAADQAAAMQTVATQIEATLLGQDATPTTIAANDGEFVYDLPADQPLAVEVIEATQTRDGSRVGYIVFVRDGAGFVKLGPYEFDATAGVFAGSTVDSELFLAPEAE